MCNVNSVLRATLQYILFWIFNVAIKVLKIQICIFKIPVERILNNRNKVPAQVLLTMDFLFKADLKKARLTFLSIITSAYQNAESFPLNSMNMNVI